MNTFVRGGKKQKKIQHLRTQFSSVGFVSRGESRFLLLSSAERARCRLTCFNVFVGDA